METYDYFVLGRKVVLKCLFNYCFVGLLQIVRGVLF